MQFIGVRDLRTKSAEIWQRLTKEKELVITSSGKPIAVLSSISEDNLEEALRLLRRVRAMQAAEHLQRQSLQAGLDKLSLDEINREIQKARKGRAK